MAAKFFTGLPLDGPDPECVKGHGERRPGHRAAGRLRSRRWTTRTAPAGAARYRSRSAAGRPVTACDENPLAGLHTAPDADGQRRLAD